MSTKYTKRVSTKTLREGDIRPHCDFSGGVRGKHYRANREGHTVIIHKEDGSTVVQNFKIEEGAVVIGRDATCASISRQLRT